MNCIVVVHCTKPPGGLSRFSQKPAAALEHQLPGKGNIRFSLVNRMSVLWDNDFHWLTEQLFYGTMIFIG